MRQKILLEKSYFYTQYEQKKHFQQYFAENLNNIKKTWTGIKSIINIRTVSKNQPSSMLIDKSLKSNPTDIAEGFNAYFSSIAETLLPKHTPGTKHFSQYLSNRVNQNFIFESADPVEVICIFDSLDSG